jgi:tetratricopeptide (TPR) repeat protein
LLDWRTTGLFRLGEEAQADERYADASHYYEAVLHTAPDHEPARFNLGVTELRRGHVREAADIFRSLLEPRDAGERLQSRDLPIAFNLALALTCANELVEGYQVTRRVVLDALDSGPPERPLSLLRARIEGPALALLAVVLIRSSGDDARPEGCTTDPSSFNELIDRLRGKQQPDPRTARLAAERARDASVDEPRTQYLLASYDAFRHEIELALDELEDALVRDPNSIEWARRDPLLEPLRAADRREFRALIRWARAGRAALPTTLDL